MIPFLSASLRAAGAAFCLALCGVSAVGAAAAPIAAERQAAPSARLINPTTAEVTLPSGLMLTVDFYGDNIFRLFADPKGGIVRNPVATPPADILVSNPRRALSGAITVGMEGGKAVVKSPDVTVAVDAAGMIAVRDKEGNIIVEQTEPLTFTDDGLKLGLKERDNEWYYGGGVQNGRFSHRGRAIEIVNQNSWTDGGVCSPTPFYWSTGGYGILFHTFAPGRYDFGANTPGTVELTHATPYLDMFVMASKTPVGLLNDFYQLTGNPVLLPKFGFYEGHLNAYNRDYWTPDTTGTRGVPFEDGKRYTESQKDNGGIRESLNGELPGNYQFSARAVIDRYLNADMPLGWVLPNDGYGAGYGQTGSLEGNVENLRQFGDYARSKGVEIGLWTQSDLHPKEGIEPLLQRDIVREVRDAGVRVLKTDVAWVGWGYSFGLNGVADVGELMPYYGNDARPFIISLDGWAGTQRYAGIWTGDQTGGDWEYIRFHIPTYIGAGLAGQPNITSDMDGIFGGKHPVMNTRDFQWKTWTPMQLNMDGWGANEKYPQAMGEPYTSINRHYLKLKSELLPYAYTYAREAVDGKPLIRAMFIDYPSPFTQSAATRYQFLYGPDFLVAPIYQETAADSKGNDIRNGIYLPEGVWIDYFNGDTYTGGRVINSFPAPLWKTPVFVRQGAIIPMVNPNNTPGEIDNTTRIYELYPAPGTSEMTEYDDDGTTEAYLRGESTETPVAMTLTDKGDLTVTIGQTTGSFKGYNPFKRTELRINATAEPKKVEAIIGGKKCKLAHVSLNQWNGGYENAWTYDPAPELNRFATPGSDFASEKITKNPQILVRLAMFNTADNAETVTVKGYEYAVTDRLAKSHGALTAPAAGQPTIRPYSATPRWKPVENADYYEVLFDGISYSTIAADSLFIDDLLPETDYTFSVRAVNADGASPYTDLAIRTLDNPLEHAIEGIRGRSSAPDQPGFEAWHLFDRAESGDVYHSLYGTKAVPSALTIDLVSVNTLDKMDYLPRHDAGNGTILAGTVQTSMDGNTWTDPVPFTWQRDGSTKTFTFDSHPTARYVRINVDKATGNYVSGREIYIYRTPGSEHYLQGDINKDGRIDENDLTSYMNYTGLRRGDSDFDYVAIGDVNANGLIDAYDISLVARELDGGLQLPDSVMAAPAGSLDFALSSRRAVNAGDEVKVTVSGRDLQRVNALSFALPYNAADFEYVSTDASGLDRMTNLTYDRLHTSGDKVLYPTFVNRGTRTLITGSEPLITITFRARRRAAFTLDPADIILVGPDGSVR